MRFRWRKEAKKRNIRSLNVLSIEQLNLSCIRYTQRSICTIYVSVSVRVFSMECEYIAIAVFVRKRKMTPHWENMVHGLYFILFHMLFYIECIKISLVFTIRDDSKKHRTIEWDLKNNRNDLIFFSFSTYTTTQSHTIFDGMLHTNIAGAYTQYVTHRTTQMPWQNESEKKGFHRKMGIKLERKTWKTRKKLKSTLNAIITGSHRMGLFTKYIFIYFAFA